ncbi:type II toxin-antitoxin system ParD family antitoxin [Methylobacterium sp. J-076]|uniref:ribbon-helix-helix domain-containing protein n=1 Tax=Methylobacterium sp. J-076 TaxID=2836655 RepID=UPI001FB8E84D|nr:type II toxin-antitoxin system ParD family antitoxin [Methylobacterium sp. J-076]MCJ2011512.1 type II toxin-antitoxin system ParD family antitoxin [Methylobacterium sp. J-076]
MPVRRTITVSITQEQDDLIRACLVSGRYASASEVVRAALRSLGRDEVRDLADRAKPAIPESRA